jgi:hypothetical protein
MYDTVYLNPSIVTPPYFFSLVGRDSIQMINNLMLADFCTEELIWKGDG